jgi:N-methylhydantoinase A
MDGFAEQMRARGVERFRHEYFVEARYMHQVWELLVPLPQGYVPGADDVAVIVDAFHQLHETIFAVSEQGQEVEFIHWKGRVTGELDRPPLTPMAANNAGAPVPERTAPAYFPATGPIVIPLYRGETLTPGVRVDGPALIVEPTTTIVLYPGSAATVTSFNNYMVDVPT